MSESKTYLGDGVYASFDGYQIWLHAERDHDSHDIALEPETLQALNAFDKRIREAIAGAKSASSNE